MLEHKDWLLKAKSDLKSAKKLFKDDPNLTIFDIQDTE